MLLFYEIGGIPSCKLAFDTKSILGRLFIELSGLTTSNVGLYTSIFWILVYELTGLTI